MGSTRESEENSSRACLASSRPNYGGFADQRRQTRYDLRVPAGFQWKIPGESRHLGEGFTRDISEGGMFLLAEDCPPPGTTIRINVSFPPLGRGSSLQMRAKAVVLRVEAKDSVQQRSGFAVVTKTFVLQSLERSLMGRHARPRSAGEIGEVNEGKK